jgi:hypothetical protein
MVCGLRIGNGYRYRFRYRIGVGIDRWDAFGAAGDWDGDFERRGNKAINRK